MHVTDELTAEKQAFDIRIATEVMKWKQLDDSLLDDFKKHVLPASTYPFFVKDEQTGILVYHPTAYHSRSFSPSLHAEDDISAFILLLGNQPESLSSSLSMLHFIHHHRALKDVSFRPDDEYYRISKYYRPGDFSTLALHLLDCEEKIKNRSVSKEIMDISEKYLGKFGVARIDYLNGKLKVQVSEKLSQEVESEIESLGYPVDYIVN